MVFGGPDGETDSFGPLYIWDPGDDSVETLDSCTAPADSYWPVREPVGHICPSGSLLFGHGLTVSPDGRYMVGVGFDPNTAPADPHAVRTDALFRMWDLETMEVLSTFHLPYHDGIGHGSLGPLTEEWFLILDGFAGTGPTLNYRAFDPWTHEELGTVHGTWREARASSSDLSTMYLVDESGVIHQVDTSTWSTTRTWQGIESRSRGMALSPGEDLLAISGENSLIAVWDLTSEQPVLVDRIPLDGWASDMMWIDDERMAAALVLDFGKTAWRVVDLDPEAVVSEARASLNRDFDAEECSTYGIERCQ